MKVGIDVFGNICVLKFNYETKQKDKKKFALNFLKEHKNVTTILEKSGKFSGRLRTQDTKWIAGERTKEALYRENSCVFRLNVDTCYFSPRLSEERKQVAKKVKKKEEVLVMFGGVAPFAVVIGKIAKPKKVVSVELGRECTKYARINVKRNKLENVEIIGGDVRKKCSGMKNFDRIIMARPNLKDSFLDVAFPLVKKNGEINYYGFSENRKFTDSKTFQIKKVLDFKEEELKEMKEMKEMILEEARKMKRKIKILRIVKAGDIGVRKWRYRIDIKVLN